MCVCVYVCVRERERQTEYDGALYDIKDKFITDTRFKKSEEKVRDGREVEKRGG